jgi:hypothetical protein
MRPRSASAQVGLSLALSLWILAPAAAISQPADNSALPPGVKIGVEVRPQTATVGDPIQVFLDISYPAGFQVRFTEPPRQIGDFALLECNPGPDLPSQLQAPGPAGSAPPAQSGKTPHYRARLVVAVYKTGDFTFPALKVRLRAPGGKETDASSAEVKIHIQSVLAEKDAALEGLKKQADIPEPVHWLQWFARAALILGLAATGWWLWRRRRRASPSVARPKLDPFEMAESALRHLAAQKLLEKGMIKQYHVLLSDIFKMIIAGGYDIQTTEKTTSEIIEEVRATAGRSAERQPAETGPTEIAEIESWLSACDMVKFAKYIPPLEKSLASYDSAQRMLRHFKDRRTSLLQSESPPMSGVS